MALPLLTSIGDVAYPASQSLSPISPITEPLLAGLHNSGTPKPVTRHAEGMRYRRANMSMKAPGCDSIPASEVPVSNQIRGYGDPEARP